ncbi:chromosome partitioning protein [Micromonospora sp. NPDC092111]|uniref:MinD/ParA family ATP-binding protein n=1 Tax=Micromonospora sp. NPDC092111 TaxID=3364289 RepID=UPI00382FB6D4
MDLDLPFTLDQSLAGPAPTATGPDRSPGVPARPAGPADRQHGGDPRQPLPDPRNGTRPAPASPSTTLHEPTHPDAPPHPADRGNADTPAHPTERGNADTPAHPTDPDRTGSPPVIPVQNGGRGESPWALPPQRPSAGIEEATGGTADDSPPAPRLGPFPPAPGNPATPPGPQPPTEYPPGPALAVPPARTGPPPAAPDPTPSVPSARTGLDPTAGVAPGRTGPDPTAAVAPGRTGPGPDQTGAQPPVAYPPGPGGTAVPPQSAPVPTQFPPAPEPFPTGPGPMGSGPVPPETGPVPSGPQTWGPQQSPAGWYGPPWPEQPGPAGVPPADRPAPVGYPDPVWSPEGGIAPTAEDFARRRQIRPADPIATMGVRAVVNKMGLVKLPPGRHEQELKRDIEMVRRNFGGLRQVTVVNPKGGAGKTVAILLLAMTFGQKRGGYVLAWDNNETQGTLGMRAQQDFHSRTVRDMLRDLGQFQGAHGRIGDLSQYVRSQGEGMFDVLASDESATGGEMLTAAAFAEIREVVSRFYKLIFVDTGNNVRAQNWQAAMDATDQLVVTMSARNDSAETAARMLDHLEQSGRQRLVRQAVTVVSMPPSRKEIDLPAIQEHFAARTRAVLLAPYERLIDTGEPIRYGGLTSATRDAWLKIAAAVAEGL